MAITQFINAPIGHMAGELEVLPNGGIVLLSKRIGRGGSQRIVLARTKRDFVTWRVHIADTEEIVCELGHYFGGGMSGMENALADYKIRR